MLPAHGANMCIARIVTWSGSPLVYVWDANSQQDRTHMDRHASVPPNTPDLVLTGHVGKAEYALDFSKISRKIASGGRDGAVLVWAFDDATRTSALAPSFLLTTPRAIPFFRASISLLELYFTSFDANSIIC